MPAWYPLLILLVGLTIVLGGILVLRVNAFLSLITAAIVVSLLAPGEWSEKIPRVAAAFGATAAGIGIVIALAAVIGQAMLKSGAADRVVAAALAVFGERRAPTALMASAFTLAIPVFFDTVFYLMLPLVKSLYRSTGKHYVKYLAAVISCAAAHALVPPTPGPLFVASQLGVDLGVMILVGVAVGTPAAAASLVYANWIERRIQPDPAWGEVSPEVNEPSAPIASEDAGNEPPLPGIMAALAPVSAPVALIAAKMFAVALSGEANEGGPLVKFLSVAGDPNVALLLSASLAAAYLLAATPPIAPADGPDR